MGGPIGTSNVYKVKHRCNTSYQADMDAEGGGASSVVELAEGVLNTDDIARWWWGYAYEAASYHSIEKNCSTTVIRALRAGGSDRHVSVMDLGLRGRTPTVDFLSKQTGWEPTDITAYLRLMNRRLGNAMVDLDAIPARALPRRNSMVEGTGVAMCEAHGQPLASCGAC